MVQNLETKEIMARMKRRLRRIKQTKVTLRLKMEAVIKESKYKLNEFKLNYESQMILLSASFVSKIIA